MPLVSVVVPTHNRPEMLAEALASVRAQTFTDYEIIVVSNGEGARQRLSYDVAQTYQARHYAWPEGNVSAARNFGIAVAKGEWIAFLDDDDLWLPSKLELQIEAAERIGVDMITCDCIEMFSDGREKIRQDRVPKGWSYVRALSWQRWGTLPSMVMVRRSVLDEVRGFDSDLGMAEDMDLWRRISWRHTIHQMHEVLALRRAGHPSLSQNRWGAHINDLRHYLKIVRATPPDLRSEIPSPARLFTRLLFRAIVPTWIRQPRKIFRGMMRAFPLKMIMPMWLR